MHLGLPSQWVRHLPPQDKELQKNFEAAVRNSTTALSRLREIFQEELDSITRKETSDEQFEDPSWSHKRAYWDGQRSKILAHLSLITLDQ
jgi:hypothetical protein